MCSSITRFNLSGMKNLTTFKPTWLQHVRSFSLHLFLSTHWDHRVWKILPAKYVLLMLPVA